LIPKTFPIIKKGGGASLWSSENGVPFTSAIGEMEHETN
jgi:hypothetical protein